MSTRDKNYWNSFYSSEAGIKEAEHSSFLAQMLPYLKKGKVMDIACGTGRNSFYLADNGFDVDGIDFSDVAINKCLARSASFKGDKDFKVQSLDFFLMPIQKYDSVIIIDFKAPGRLLDESRKALTTGGTLLLETYTLNHLKNKQGIDIPADECYKPFELARLLKDWNIIYYDERANGDEYKVKALVVKPSY